MEFGFDFGIRKNELAGRLRLLGFGGSFRGDSLLPGAALFMAGGLKRLELFQGLVERPLETLFIEAQVEKGF